ncbi:hypothetical protein HDG37_002847 [Paraburkholderia sp. MM5384-R2]|nr:hypothetical protein [Paraburkholderia sp. MM5384-R2]
MGRVARQEDVAVPYHAALTECTRERVPLDWAPTQANLRAALSRPGERGSGTALLEEAVAAFQTALTEPSACAFDWADAS